MLIDALLLTAGAKLYSDGCKSLKMDAQAMTKYGKAFTREYEAQQLVKQKHDLADKRLENVAKKKNAIITATMPMFIDVYSQIQKINIQSKEKHFEIIEFSEYEKTEVLQSISLVTQKQFTTKELVVGMMFKGFSGMIVEDSKRNLSAARSQVSAANAAYSQAQSIAEVYDAVIGRADRISKLLMNMNALFLGIISETEKIINEKGINSKNYSEKEKSTIVLCVDFAVAMTKLLDIPVVDLNGELAHEAVEMIQTGEEYLTRINKIINDEV